MFAISLNDYIVAQLKREADLELLQSASREQNTSKQTHAVNRQWVGKMPKYRLAKACVGAAWQVYGSGERLEFPLGWSKFFLGSS